MKNYTLQRDLGNYGARWGCYATAIINIVENEINRKLTEHEIFAVIGVWHKSGSIYIANYHNHNAPLERGNNWDQKNDPEWHFLVGNPDNALLDVFYAINKTPVTKKAKYKIVLYEIGHYCLNIGLDVINPDPSINIKGVKIIESINMGV